MVELNNKIYKFRIIGNYDIAALGASGTALDNSKTQFLICEDVMEADDSSNARHGFRYLVARPRYLWNAYSPRLFSGSVYNGQNPIVQSYSNADLIDVVSVFDDSVYEPLELDYTGDLKAYISTFNSTTTPLMNWNEIDDSSIIKCYFLDLNRDARTRESGSSSSVRYLPVWL